MKTTVLFDLYSSEHIFVWARPKRGDWSDFDNSLSQCGKSEWRPCKIEGRNKLQRLFVAGSDEPFHLGRFEIGSVISIPEQMPCDYTEHSESNSK